MKVYYYPMCNQLSTNDNDNHYIFFVSGIDNNTYQYTDGKRDDPAEGEGQWNENGHCCKVCDE